MVEKKETAKTEKPEKPKKETKKEAPKPESKAEGAPEAEKSGAGNKKINKMRLAEVETKLEEIKGAMGGYKSRYAQHLIRRKNILISK